MENRKIKLSKQLLKQALLELLEEKKLHQISIRELCAKADLNRSTFYAHYEDINYLIQDLENDIIKDMPFMDYRKNKSEKDILEYAKFIEKNYQKMIALVQNGLLISRIVENSVEFFLKEGTKTEKEIEQFTLLTHFCVSGSLQSLFYYASQCKHLTTTEISQIIYKMYIEAENIRKKV